MLDGTGIDGKILTVSQERCMVFIYREAVLKEYLRRKEVRGFLESYGYDKKDLDWILQKLSSRVCQYSCDGRGFPHEIGAFLDLSLIHIFYIGLKSIISMHIISNIQNVQGTIHLVWITQR